MQRAADVGALCELPGKTIRPSPGRQGIHLGSRLAIVAVNREAVPPGRIEHDEYGLAV